MVFLFCSFNSTSIGVLYDLLVSTGNYILYDTILFLIDPYDLKAVESFFVQTLLKRKDRSAFKKLDLT